MKTCPLTQSCNHSSGPGFALLELVIVIAILAVVAAVAVPSLSSSTERRLDLAADRFSAAMRFARTESVRTGDRYGIHHDANEKRLRVFRADTSTNPATIVYDVYNPVTKQIYDDDLSQDTIAAVDTVTRNTLFRGTCTDPGMVYFDPNGTPWCNSPDTVLLESYELVFLGGASQLVITLDGISGRVTVR